MTTAPHITPEGLQRFRDALDDLIANPEKHKQERWICRTVEAWTLADMKTVGEMSEG